MIIMKRIIMVCLSFMSLFAMLACKSLQTHKQSEVPTQITDAQESEQMVEITGTYLYDNKVCIKFKTEPGEIYAVFIKDEDSAEYYVEWADTIPHIAGEDKYIIDKWSQPLFIVAESTETTYEIPHFSSVKSLTFTVAHLSKDYSVFLSKYNEIGVSQSIPRKIHVTNVIKKGEELSGFFATEQEAKACADAYGAYGLTFVDFDPEILQDGPHQGCHNATFHLDGLYDESSSTVKETLDNIICSGKSNGWPELYVNYSLVPGGYY